MRKVMELSMLSISWEPRISNRLWWCHGMGKKQLHHPW